ncbi:hypothetical protein [Oceanirhabdus sp. W0125-5]|uniref:hypothetical protein n=1 Tax=Oceanirhabdus sp. W0125-5 TaxID=2999116 RepID=UPI0022F2B67A|nr:hypothetical protein [Oceanirhabdus sp. W0125-5]WBW96956.1 hypothetical protein OW730_25190 [Oceanirhabdus sp. W0125-5]
MSKLKQNKQLLKSIEYVVRGEKEKFILWNGVIVRGVVLVAVLSITFGYIYGEINEDLNKFLTYLIVKLIIGVIIGYFTGLIEWKYYYSIINEDYDKKSYKKIAILDGIVGWGLLSFLAQIGSNNDDMISIFVNLICWIGAGIFFGYQMWRRIDVSGIRKTAREYR